MTREARYVLFSAGDLLRVRKQIDYQQREALRKRKLVDHRIGVRQRYTMDTRPFIFWDGEGPKDTAYSLFGSSAGDELCHPNLDTVECLDLLLSRAAKSDAIHCWFGGNYDVSMILKDLPERCWRQLMRFNNVIWRGYRINFVPHKWFSVSDGVQRIKVFDVRSFFGGSFISALEKFKVGLWATPEYQSTVQSVVKNLDSDSTLTQKVVHLAWLLHNYRGNAQNMKVKAGNSGQSMKVAIAAFQTLTDVEVVALFKHERGNFRYCEIPLIRRYWKLELKYGVVLMEQLRQIFADAGFMVRSWHGPGALARVALNRHKIRDAMSVAPSSVRLAAMYAFAGGRFEMPRGGHVNGPVYNADLQSAYPHFARDLPNLARGKWRYSPDYEPGKFAIWHIDYRATNRSRDRIYPLFRRVEGGEVCWPAEVEGWYHSPEAELVANDPDATIIEGYVFDEDDPNDRPFAWIEDYFNKRATLKRIGNPAEFTFKLIINSVYGQLAQRTGYDKRNRKAPRYHQLEWAGYITSACRAQMYRLGLLAGTDLISIDTDGIYSRSPIPVLPGSGLGEWDTNRFADGVFWQSGIYALRSEDADWHTGTVKTRGIPKGQYTADTILASLASGDPIHLTKHNFVTCGHALAGHRWEDRNSWEDVPIDFVFGGRGKRYHNEVRCKTYCEHNGLHLFVQRPIGPGLSLPHVLPWLSDQLPERMKHDDWVLFDINSLEEDDRYELDVLEYAV